LLKTKREILKIYLKKGEFLMDLFLILGMILFRNVSIFSSNCDYQEQHFLLQIAKYIIFFRIRKTGQYLQFIKREYDILKNYIDLLKLLIILIVTGHIIVNIFKFPSLRLAFGQGYHYLPIMAGYLKCMRPSHTGACFIASHSTSPQ
jgi:hypothetical protein